MSNSRATLSRAGRPERGRERATGSAEGVTAARPGRLARLEDVQKVLTGPSKVVAREAADPHVHPESISPVTARRG